MANRYLPPEILDYIVDLLHDDPKALQNCCLTSKSCIPRTRTHLFSGIWFTTKRLKSWKEMFPDPPTSPACYTKTLLVDCPHVVTAADAEAGGWITGFSRVVSLEVRSETTPGASQSAISLVPFHRFAPTVKSLHVTFTALPFSRIFDVILSFPPLEDLTVRTHDTSIGRGDGSFGLPTVSQPLIPPVSVGTLELYPIEGMEPIAHRLLSIPGGIRFREISFSWFQEEDISPTTALVEGCAHTLEYLDMTCELRAQSRSISIDLSKATRLKDTVFVVQCLSVDWITLALRTITPNHRDLGRISIFVYFDSTLTSVSADVRQNFGEQIFGQWLELDRVLAKLWESHSIRPMILYHTRPQKEKEEMRECMRCLFPEITGRGVIELIPQIW